MAYNNGFPMSYPQMYPQYNYAPQVQQIPQQQIPAQQNENTINWVQGVEGAKSWAVAPGKSVMLMDSEASVFYIKSSDNSGMPMPLRIFDYQERIVDQTPKNEVAPRAAVDTSQFVTWDAFNKKLKEIFAQQNGNSQNNQKKGRTNTDA